MATIDPRVDAYIAKAADFASRSSKRSPARVPADLTAALKNSRKAATAFAAFSPSHKREYVEWITEAKREETRQKRIETTIKVFAR